MSDVGPGQSGFEQALPPATRRAMFDIRRLFERRLSTIEGATPGEPNGFEDRSDCVLSFDNATRTLTLTGDFTYFANGNKFSRSGSITFQISAAEGPHYVYFDSDGTLSETFTFDPAVIGEFCFVTYIYWDATNGEAVPWAMCEQHGSSMSAVTHSYLHNTRGAVRGTGMLAAPVSIDGSGDDDDDARITVAAGEMWDEDIRHTVLAHGATDAIPWLYRLGANGDWRMDDSSEFVTRKGTSFAYWNEFTGGAWQLTEANNADFVCAHLFAVPGVNETNGAYVIVAGQDEYDTLGGARDGAQVELQALQLDGLPSPEFVAVATFLTQTGSAFSNAVATKIISSNPADGEEFIDWRRVLWR